MSKEDVIIYYGLVTELLKDANFRVEINADANNNPVSKKLVICHPSGKIRTNRIKIANGDIVKVEFSPYSIDKGRIVERMKNQA
jgi:translation initiation factor IF-1